MNRDQAVETPSGKGSGDENFPVGSWLLRAALRPHVACFYRFARAIDDIADNPALAPDDKIARLQGFEDVVTTRTRVDPAFATAERMRASLAETGVTARHCVDLISAFKQDAIKGRYRDWHDLMDYCDRSAAPVGRYLLDLHGERREGYPASDALCNALQVINHLQDCGDDYRRLDRVYLPQAWMERCGTHARDLAAAAASPGLRQVLDLALDGADELLEQAAALPAGLASRRLAMESSAIVAIAQRLVSRLRRRDPLAGRVVLGKTEYLACCVSSVARVAFRGAGALDARPDTG